MELIVIVPISRMQTGGGGGGGNGAWSGDVSAGSGSFGSCFGGGSGGGGNRSQNDLDAGMNATDSWVVQVVLVIMVELSNPPRGGATILYGSNNENGGTADDGEGGTGGLVVIVAKGNITVGPGGSIVFTVRMVVMHQDIQIAIV